jgi:uncharacterized protein
MNTTAQTKFVVQTFLEAIGSRDLEKICSLFSEEIDWLIPGNEKVASWLGSRKTKQEVADFFKELWENTKPLAAQIDYLIAEDNVAIVSGNFSTLMTRTGKSVSSLFFIQIVVKDGFIINYRLLEDTLGVSKAMEK